MHWRPRSRSCSSPSTRRGSPPGNRSSGSDPSEADGLALSSRNAYLSAEERRAAGAIPRALDEARQAVVRGERSPAAVVAAARSVLDAEPLLRVDYVELVDTAKLQPVAVIEGEMLLAVAVYAGKTRLIDNIVVTL